MSQDSKFLLLGFPALGGGVHPLQFNLRKGLEFSIKNLTSSMSLGHREPHSVWQEEEEAPGDDNQKKAKHLEPKICVSDQILN